MIARLALTTALLWGCASSRRATGVPPHDTPAESTRDEEPSGPDASTTVVTAACGAIPEGSVCVPAGLSVLGADTGEPRFEERPPRAVRLHAFAIDRTEVRARRYRACVHAGRCQPLSCGDETNTHDGVARCVTWTDAAAYCAYRHGRLPTEAEWERAASGAYPEHHLYVWGDTAPEAGTPHDRTPDGIERMAGGVAEWIADGGDFYPALPRLPVFDGGADGGDASLDPDATDGALADLPERTESGLFVYDQYMRDPDASVWRVARGGDDAIPLARRTNTLRRFRRPGDTLRWIGVRCVYDVPGS